MAALPLIITSSTSVMIFEEISRWFEVFTISVSKLATPPINSSKPVTEICESSIVTAWSSVPSNSIFSMSLILALEIS